DRHVGKLRSQRPRHSIKIAGVESHGHRIAGRFVDRRASCKPFRDTQWPRGYRFSEGEIRSRHTPAGHESFFTIRVDELQGMKLATVAHWYHQRAVVEPHTLSFDALT